MKTKKLSMNLPVIVMADDDYEFDYHRDLLNAMSNERVKYKIIDDDITIPMYEKLFPSEFGLEVLQHFAVFYTGKQPSKKELSRLMDKILDTTIQ